jgi:hypothetical protein
MAAFIESNLADSPLAILDKAAVAAGVAAQSVVG